MEKREVETSVLDSVPALDAQTERVDALLLLASLLGHRAASWQYRLPLQHGLAGPRRKVTQTSPAGSPRSFSHALFQWIIRSAPSIAKAASLAREIRSKVWCDVLTGASCC